MNLELRWKGVLAADAAVAPLLNLETGICGSRRGMTSTFDFPKCPFCMRAGDSQVEDQEGNAAFDQLYKITPIPIPIPIPILKSARQLSS